MRGRLENQIATEDKIQVLLNESPDILRQYYNHLSNKSYNTKRNYVYRIINFLKFIEDNGIDVNNNDSYKKIKPSMINEYLDKIKYKDDETMMSESYRATSLFAVKSFFSFLEDEEIIIKSPCKKIIAPRVSNNTDIVYLTQEEISLVRQNIINGVGTSRAISYQYNWKERDSAIIQLALGTGLRVGALSEINIEDVDIENSTIRVTEKENITKDIYLNKPTLKCLKDWICKRSKILSDKEIDIDALFISMEMKRISPRSINRLIKKYTYNIDKKITAHKLRATFATNVYEATNDIYITSSLLGHSKVDTTKRYANINKNKKIAAVNAIECI